MTFKPSEAAVEIFKLQKEINKLIEKQDKLKEELQCEYILEPFDNIETLLGTVNIVVKGGAKYSYTDPAAAEKEDLYIEILKSFSDRKKEFAEQSKALTVEAKEPTKLLAAVRKEFSEKFIPEGAETNLRFTINK